MKPDMTVQALQDKLKDIVACKKLIDELQIEIYSIHKTINDLVGEVAPHVGDGKRYLVGDTLIRINEDWWDTYEGNYHTQVYVEKVAPIEIFKEALGGSHDK